MSKQEIKLQRIKKSCKISSKVVSVTFVILIVVCAMLLVGMIVAAANAKALNEAIITTGMEEDINSFINVEQMNFTSDIPALQEYFDANQYKYAFSVIAYLGVMFAYSVVACVSLGFAKHIFKLLEQTESPFDKRILKTLKITFIFLSVVIALSLSNVFGVICALIFWCIYNFFSYGCELQKLSDETL